MKRHTTEPQRYGHHERAGIARRIARIVKRKTKGARLKLIALDARCSDGYYTALVLFSEGMRLLMRRECHRRQRLSAKRQEVEGEPA